ncbi:ribonuclease HI family protein [Candidatus Gottesmanbacteria bacterium]|nr:ribonuclease HI family protein [Candidatus Gottesmanbacteria bacterium]
MQLVIHTDGGARGNPGPSGIGVVIEECTCASPRNCGEKNKKLIAAFGKRIGEGTNNTAEYTAVVEALTYLRDSGKNYSGSTVSFYLDSTLVVNQLNGLYKIKQPHLRDLLMKVRSLESELGINVTYGAVPREQNSAADFQVNKALDES